MEIFAGCAELLDEPLRQVEGTQEKARVLTLLGYSLRAQGLYDRATAFHQQALEIARGAGDQICEIANLNHLSRICVAQKNYAEAINYSSKSINSLSSIRRSVRRSQRPDQFRLQ
jgi:tetratricopeptide (TPR) repeat protein